MSDVVEQIDQRHAALAARCLPVLAVNAMAAPGIQLVSYEWLHETLGMTGDVPVRVGNMLDWLASWTHEHGLPDIASIVVNKQTQQPGYFDNPTRPSPYSTTAATWAGELGRIRAVGQRWFDLHPTADEIAAAYQRWRQSVRNAG